MEEIDRVGIRALVPYYGEWGENQTLIYSLEGDIFCYPHGMRNFLQLFVRQQELDLYQLRKKYGELLQKRNGIPLPLGFYLVLIPVKLREPIAKGDGAYGYVVLEQVEKIEEESKQGVFYLQGGLRIPTLWSKKVLHQQLLYGRLVQQAYEQEQRRKFDLYYTASPEFFSVQEPMEILASFADLSYNKDKMKYALLCRKNKLL
ncbi:MAG: hypothetical protein GX962_03350, partial [Epulopiscium sp.]|nr:hypothetical protein [Candidatus Epulonipiscium sp.]